MSLLCSACDTDETVGGNGQWHNRFKRTFLPLNMFVTDAQGNLAHKENGDTNFEKYALKTD